MHYDVALLEDLNHFCLIYEAFVVELASACRVECCPVKDNVFVIDNLVHPGFKVNVIIGFKVKGFCCWQLFKVKLYFLLGLGFLL